MSDASAGQEGPTPSFIPGWFDARPGNPDPAMREAVRIPVVGDFFPITFLRDNERVSPSKRPQLGFTISTTSMPDLAVPSGYWIVRDSDGRLRNWTDEDFKAKWSRSDREWRPPVERDVPSGRPAAAERNRHGAEDTVRATIVASPDPDEVGREGEVPVEALGAPGLTDEQRDQLRYVDGWQGTPPAEGTRRKLLLETLKRWLLDNPGKPVTMEVEAIELADAIEEALQRVEGATTDTVPEAATVRPKGNVPAGTRELHIVLDHGTPASMMHCGPKFVEIETQDGVSVGGFESHWRPGTELQHIVIPYGRDDAWVREVAGQAAGAASGVFLRADGNMVMPSEEVGTEVDRVLAEFGISGLKEGGLDSPAFNKALEEVAAEQDTEARKYLEEQVEKLLGQREEARTGEGRYAEERDCAFALLRWLLPTTVAKRLD